MSKVAFGYLLAACAMVLVGQTKVMAESNATTEKLKAVVHVNFDDAKRQTATLGNVEHILADVGDDNVEIVVVCHGPGLSLLTKSESGGSAEIAQLQKRGVQFHACENTMKKEKVTKEDLLPGVTTTPSGAVEVLRKQQQGFSYLKP